MLEQKFKHKSWFKDSNITVKDFLDYVLQHSGDFFIKVKNTLKTDNLFDIPLATYYLTDNRYSYKLNIEECKYLSDNNNYFKSKLS